MRNKTRRWEAAGDDDPLAGLVNLFDVWMVFSIALLIAMIGTARSQASTATTSQADAASASPPVDQPLDKKRRLPSFRVSEDKLSGKGQRLGTAYRLQSGEVVYVPD